MLANILLQIQQAGTEVATEAVETTAKLNIFSLTFSPFSESEI